jgi:HPt (histidine-containing phosphotransfer) domain-containing protein
MATLQRVAPIILSSPLRRGWSCWQGSLLALLVMGSMAWIAATGQLRGDDERAEFFRQRVEPILREHCYACHSHSAGQMESGLALDWKSGWSQGGERGPAVVPGKVSESLLIRAVQHVDAELMMPEEQLAADEIDVLLQWVQQGAYDDRVAAPAAEDDTDWWSLQPLRKPPFPTLHDSNADRASHPIDAFVQARLEQAGLSLAPPAEPRELMRRLYFDLVGLPPPMEEVARFVAEPSAEAYDLLVDELLASPRYGERWARHWLDTIHFAESHGYEHDVGRDHAWPYRDYVIEAFNRDTPWGTFIRQQLAVDYFEPEASELTPALGFLGAGTFDLSTYTTGPVTFDYHDRDDMLTQTMAAFVSMTANCARCHAHKFDPIPQEDYYALQAVFAGIIKGEIGYDADHRVAAERQRWNALLEAANRGDAAILQLQENQRRVAEWLGSRRGKQATWTPLELLSFVSVEGATLASDSDGLIVASGSAADKDVYVISASSPLQRVSALRLDLFADDSLPMQGPGRAPNGNLHLSEVSLTVFAAGEQSGRKLAISRATADFNQEGWGVERAIDGAAGTAWGIHPAVGQPHHAVFELEPALDLAPGSTLTIALKQLHGGSHLIGAFRLSVSDGEAEQVLALPGELEQALRLEASERSEEQASAIARHVARLAAEAELSQLPAQRVVYAAGDSVAIPAGNGSLQMASLSSPKVVHLLQRGDIDKPKHEVPPGALSAVTELTSRFTDISVANEAARRGALADWIAHHDNHLTWRSAVNRLWHYHFGRGLCDTPSDFGRMGGIPSHPELIDWMAVWFRDEAQGSLKQLHRLIVTSQTYQQSSRSSRSGEQVDADNRLWWRQELRRLDAEAYRDAVRFVSGQLDLTMGGPAIQHFQQSPGPQLTPKLDYSAYDWSAAGSGRRSVYRYVWRGIPDPLMFPVQHHPPKVKRIIQLFMTGGASPMDTFDYKPELERLAWSNAGPEGEAGRVYRAGRGDHEKPVLVRAARRVGPLGQQRVSRAGQAGRRDGVPDGHDDQDQRAWSRHLHDEQRVSASRVSLHGRLDFVCPGELDGRPAHVRGAARSAWSPLQSERLLQLGVPAARA